MAASIEDFEPQVGEIRAVRTFRVGPGGMLYPLFGSIAWSVGTNTASCRLHPNEVAGGAHAIPAPDCSCGFYAYADQPAAGEYLQSEHVLAVVACWGRVIVGTRGLRAEFARIDALWMSATVPVELVDASVRAYPGVAVYADRDRMLREHPVTVLPSYEQAAPPTGRRRTLLWWCSVAAALTLGSLSTVPFTTGPGRSLLWVATGALLAVGAVSGRLRADEASARRRILALFATALWVLAGLAGNAGNLLVRVPLAALAVAGVLITRRMRRAAATFPADVTGRAGRRHWF